MIALLVLWLAPMVVGLFAVILVPPGQRNEMLKNSPILVLWPFPFLILAPPVALFVFAVVLVPAVLINTFGATHGMPWLGDTIVSGIILAGTAALIAVGLYKRLTRPHKPADATSAQHSEALPAAEVEVSKPTRPLYRDVFHFYGPKLLALLPAAILFSVWFDPFGDQTIFDQVVMTFLMSSLIIIPLCAEGLSFRCYRIDKESRLDGLCSVLFALSIAVWGVFMLLGLAMMFYAPSPQ